MTWPGALVKSMSAAGSETYKAMAADLGCEVGRLQSRLPMLPAFDADSTVYRKIVQMASTTEHVKASGGIAQWGTATDQTCFGLMSSRKTGVEHTEEEAEDGREFPGLMTWSQKLSSCQSWLDDVYSAGYRRYTVAVAALWPSRRSRYKTENVYEDEDDNVGYSLHRQHIFRPQSSSTNLLHVLLEGLSATERLAKISNRLSAAGFGFTMVESCSTHVYPLAIQHR